MSDENIEDMIGAAIDELGSDEAGGIEADPVAEAAPEEIEAEPAEESDEEPAPIERARDPKSGKFAKGKPAPKPPDKMVKAEEVAEESAAPAPASAQPPPKIPQSWKASERELAARLPAEFRPLLEAAYRRDVEAARVLSETAEARKTVEAVRSTLQPYEAVARANGMDAMQYAGSVLQSAAVLQMGSPQQKAALVAGLIKQYGISPDDVNPFLSGEAQPPRAPQQPAFNPRAEVQRVLAEERANMEREQNQRVVQEFLESKPEFLNDVMDDVTEILRLDRSRGGNMTPQQAYDRAVKMSESVQTVLAQRKAEQAAKAKNASAQRARQAAVSIRPSPPLPAARGKASSRPEDDVEAAIAELEAR